LHSLIKHVINFAFRSKATKCIITLQEKLIQVDLKEKSVKLDKVLWFF